jgi:ABC-type antimicrobial peptide transport system permease subunit
MRGFGLAVTIVGVAALVTLALLFFLQNQETEVRLFLNLGVQAWATEPQSLPGLLLGSALVGFLVGTIFGATATLFGARRRSSARDPVEETL